MKPALLLFILLISVSQTLASQAQPVQVVDRTARGKWEIRTENLELLNGLPNFETKNFRVVLAKSNDPIALSVIDEDLALRAGTTLHHLEKARSYFIEKLNSEEVKVMPQTIVRLELKNKWSELGHYMNDNREPQFNTALSVPAGVGLPGRDIEPWGKEIWFRPKKEIPTSEILAAMPEDPMSGTLRQVREAVYPMQLESTLRSALYYLFAPGPPRATALESIVRQAGTLLLVEGALQASRVVNRVMLPKNYFIDSALVPEIIYHEYSHIALSDKVDVSISTPVVEGMADFFAAEIAGSPKLAKKIKKYSTAIGKNAKNKNRFRIEFESLPQAHADYVLGLLWGMKKVLGPEETLQVAFEARNYLVSRDSDIRTGLVSALLEACERVCERPSLARLKLLQYFQSRGL